MTDVFLQLNWFVQSLIVIFIFVIVMYILEIISNRNR